jgi:hypothetical protein
MKNNYALIGDDVLLHKFYSPNSPIGFGRFEYQVVFANANNDVEIKNIFVNNIADAKGIAWEFAFRLKKGSWKVQSVKRVSNKENKW